MRNRPPGTSLPFGFQRLTEDIGHPKLQEHLAAMLMLMKYSPNWQVFMDRLDREFSQWGSNLMLPFPDDYDPPEMKEAANRGGLTSFGPVASA
jgi:hypothetical protein